MSVTIWSRWAEWWPLRALRTPDAGRGREPPRVGKPRRRRLRNALYYDKQRARTYALVSALGKKAVEGALAANRREFDAALHAVKLMLQEFTDEQIYQDDYPPEPRDYYASRYEFTQVGDAHCYLYGDNDVWGEKIRNEKDYQAAAADHDNLWVTCMGFHN